MNNKEQFFIRAWYESHPSYRLLLPLTWFFCLIRTVRLGLYKFGLFKSTKIARPVIVVGNITVGGTGKTILIIELIKKLKQAGFNPGVVSRGYGGKSPVWPLSVTKNSNPVLTGDEPALIARKTDCPVVVGPSRVEDCEVLIHRYPECDVILSDDGLQHYQMQRDIEVAVFDGERIMGNGHCLPAGPLREPPSRLKTVDAVVVKSGGDSVLGVRMDVVVGDLYDLEDNNKTLKLAALKGQKIQAVAGIGNPHQFFESLRSAGLIVEEHVFEDHHDFIVTDFKFEENTPVIMTEKDAVKVKLYHPAGVWVLPVHAKIEASFYQNIIEKLKVL